MDRLRQLIEFVLPGNAFYARKLPPNATKLPLSELPFTTKAELVADQAAHPPYGTNHSGPIDQYCRLHQTSGTSTGTPLRWLDTKASWDWLQDCWDFVFDQAGVMSSDRLFFPFSFGPFLGFWVAFEASLRRGWFTLPAGGMSSTARLRYLREHRATVVCCTPTYALHLAEVARQERFDLKSFGVRLLIVAGEPGGQIVGTRELISEAWNARVIDHYGLTEMGPVAVEPFDEPGCLMINENQFIAEIDDGELILTNLGRFGSPLIRYRTGDRVKPMPDDGRFLRLDGGILGRTDDMIHLRGNNLYPSAIEAVIRRFAEVVEFRVTVLAHEALAVLKVEIEPSADCADSQTLVESMTSAFRDELLFRADVRIVPTGTLPRFEMKAKRFHRQNQ